MDTTHSDTHAYPAGLNVRSVRPATTAPPTISSSAARERREGRLPNSQNSPHTTHSVVLRRMTLRRRAGGKGAGGGAAGAPADAASAAGTHLFCSRDT